MTAAITITSDETHSEPEIHWLPWTLTLFAGFITGATGDLFALWLFAHYLNR
jgi:hypothetical protein